MGTYFEVFLLANNVVLSCVLSLQSIPLPYCTTTAPQCLHSISHSFISPLSFTPWFDCSLRSLPPLLPLHPLLHSFLGVGHKRRLVIYGEIKSHKLAFIPATGAWKWCHRAWASLGENVSQSVSNCHKLKWRGPGDKRDLSVSISFSR